MFPISPILDAILLSLSFASPCGMTQRHNILQEYFSLVKDLNQANKFKNEQTQVIFEIEYEFSGRGILYAKISSHQKIRLCMEGRLDFWTIVPNVQYFAFSEWMIKLVKQYNIEKLKLKMNFNDYFHKKFQELLAFKD